MAGNSRPKLIGEEPRRKAWCELGWRRSSSCGEEAEGSMREHCEAVSTKSKASRGRVHHRSSEGCGKSGLGAVQESLVARQSKRRFGSRGPQAGAQVIAELCRTSGGGNEA